MPWRGPEYPGEWPTLGYLIADWIQDMVVIPDRDVAGQPFILTDPELRFLLNLYRLVPETGRFYWDRGGSLKAPQKWGKGPFSAGVVCAEAEGPALFDGWDANGEPVGRPWPTPVIQVTAVSDDQTRNVWSALVPMIELGSLRAEIPDTGETRINLVGGGDIRPTTSAHRSRLGQRITFAVQDQTESYLRSNHGRTLADNQRRNLAGTGGRFLETPNAYDPREESVAQHTWEGNEPGVYRWAPDAGPGSIRNQRAPSTPTTTRAPGSGWYSGLPRARHLAMSKADSDPPPSRLRNHRSAWAGSRGRRAMISDSIRSGMIHPPWLTRWPS